MYSPIFRIIIYFGRIIIDIIVLWKGKKCVYYFWKENKWHLHLIEEKLNTCAYGTYISTNVKNNYMFAFATISDSFPKAIHIFVIMDDFFRTPFKFIAFIYLFFIILTKLSVLSWDWRLWSENYLYLVRLKCGANWTFFTAGCKLDFLFLPHVKLDAFFYEKYDCKWPWRLKLSWKSLVDLHSSRIKRLLNLL